MGNVVEMAKVKRVDLDVLERLKLLELLPREGTFTNLKLLRETKEALSFTEDENLALQFRTEMRNGMQMMVWNTIVVTIKESGKVVRAPNETLQQMVNKDPELFDWRLACPPREFMFGEVITGIIEKALKDLDKAEKLVEEQYSLYEKFIESDQE